MALTFNGSTDKLSWTGQILTAYPFTMFGWAKPTSTSINQAVMAAGINTFAEEARMYFGSGNTTRAAIVASSTSNIIDASNTPDTANWRPFMFVCTSATSRDLYYSTGLVTHDSVNVTPNFASFNRFVVGALSDGSTFRFAGDIAEIALWSSALSGANFTTLSGDVQPETVASGTLIESWSLLTAGASQVGTVSRTLTATGTTQAATHPITRTGGGGGGAFGRPYYNRILGSNINV
jgi:concanavalin A-like lectin/glucanase superfamily protein